MPTGQLKKLRLRAFSHSAWWTQLVGRRDSTPGLSDPTALEPSLGQVARRAEIISASLGIGALWSTAGVLGLWSCKAGTGFHRLSAPNTTMGLLCMGQPAGHDLVPLTMI